MSDIDMVNFSKDVKIDESLVLPIGSASVSIKDILSKYQLPQDFDTIGTEICYQTSFGREFKFADINFQDSIVPFEKNIQLLPGTFTFPPNFPVTVPPIDADLSFSTNAIGDNNRVDQLYINSSILNVQVDVSSDLQSVPASDIRIEFDFADADLHIDNGIMPSVTPTAYGVDNQLSTGSFVINLNGKTSVPFKINVYIKPQPIPITITPESVIKFIVSFTNVDYKVAYGFFSLNNDVEHTYDIPINFDSIVLNSHFKLADPTLTVNASTNLGENLNFNIDYVHAYNSATPSKVFQALFYDQNTGLKSTSKRITLNGPTVLGNWSEKIYDPIDKSNGEINNFFDNKPYPNRIDYHYSFAADPARLINYITPDSKVKVNVDVKIPFSVKEGSYLYLTDTIKDVNIGTMFDNVDSAILVLKINNGIPLKANYRMTYWKSNLPNDTIPGIVQTITDSTQMATLTSEFQINAPDVNSDGLVTANGVKTQTILIGLNKSDIEKLKLTKFIIFSLMLEGNKTTIGGVETTNPVHLSTTQSFGVKLGVFLKPNATIKLNSSN
jgi:hypothetical protein